MLKQERSNNPSFVFLLVLLAFALLAGLAACSDGNQTNTSGSESDSVATSIPIGGNDEDALELDIAEDTITPQFPLSDAPCEYGATLEENSSTQEGAEMPPGARFAQVWRVLNSGTCAWDPGTTMFYSAGTLQGITDPVNVPATPPDRSADVTVGFIAPDEPGEYTSIWKMRMANGKVLDGAFPLRIVVVPNPALTAVPTPAPTATQGSAPAPTATAAPPPTATATVPGATAQPPPQGGGWFGEYFNNPWVEGTPLTTRFDAEINFDWGTGAPMPLMPSNQFSVRWTQRVPLEEGGYRFFASSDDGIRVWVDGRLIIDEWQPVQNRTFQADAMLSAGEHDLRVEYYEEIQLAQVRFWWEQTSLFSDWRGEYFPNQQLSGSPAMVRDDMAVAFNWGRSSPSANIPNDRFSVRWTKTQEFRAGTYRFHVLMDDGARVFIDNTLIIDAWQTGNLREITGDVTLTSGAHDLRVEYFEDVLEAAVYFWWDDGTEYPDWRGEYWPNQTLTGLPTLVRNDNEVNFRWEFGSPDPPGIPDDHFSARWARFQDFERGTYRLNVTSDDGVRVYVDGNLVLNHWYNQAANQTHSVDLVLDGTHAIIITYYEDTDLASIRFWIDRVGDAP